MKLSRRELLRFSAAGMGLFLAGCSQDNLSYYDQSDPSLRSGSYPDSRPWDPYQPRTQPRIGRTPAGQPDRSSYNPPNTSQPLTGGLTRAIPRSQWAEVAPIPGRVLPMSGVKRITVHHEGWTPVYFNDFGSTAKRLEAIRRSHLERLSAGDIGYHYVIDRAGRLWEGRDVRYQGAHVRDNNAHNIGVMVLGNFDLQKPTDYQLSTLRSTLASLTSGYRVPVRSVFTHQELNPTECPGIGLQGRMVTLRHNGIA